MLNEHKQKILGGAYGISRGGSKCKFVGVTTNKSSYNHTVVYFNDDGLIWHQLSLTEDFGMYNDRRTSQHDVVGLWSDDPKPVAPVAPEPFDLEKALNGEPVMLRNGSRAVILNQVKDTLIGYFDICTPLSWKLNGYVSLYVDPDREIVGMWKEPVSKTVTVTLPRPLKEPKEDMWYINTNGTVTRSTYNKTTGPVYWGECFNAGFYFGSKEDAQAWFDTMRNSRG